MDGNMSRANGALYAFGYGLSYTSFEYSDLKITPAVITPNQKTYVTCKVTNTGKRAGDEVVQLYVRDVLSSVTTYEKNPAGFERIHLKPGETKEVSFPIDRKALELLNADMHWVVEPGDFTLMVGASSTDIRLNGTLTVVDCINDSTPQSKENEAPISASTNQETVNNVVDNDLTTFWEGNKGDYITFALQNEAKVDGISIAFHRDNGLETDFEIQLSSGGGQFLTVYSGTVKEYHKLLNFPFKGTTASDLRIVLGSDRVGITEIKLPQIKKIRYMKTRLFLLLIMCLFILPSASAQQKEYSLWYSQPAPNEGAENIVKSRGFPYDKYWERWSLPIGNGYMGACIFGRTDTERIQLTEKTFGVKGPYKKGGIGNFAEIYIEGIHHDQPLNYKRSLRLNDAISTVNYQYEGVNYTREYFANYPSNVIVVKLKADQPGKISFTLRPVLPYLHEYNDEGTGRTGKVSAQNDLITLTGDIQFFRLPYEAQIKVIPSGGQLKAMNDESGNNGTIRIQQADSVVLLINAQTAYQLKSSVFTASPENKFTGNEHPHRAVSQCIQKAVDKGYEALCKEHIADYQSLFSRVDLRLCDETLGIPTDSLLHDYQRGKESLYMDELLFQYGRYLLIASSRKGSLPPHLQGAWSQYEYAPWSGGYWHNINIQMNYWAAFNTNLAEVFIPYVEYNEAFRQSANEKATGYIKRITLTPYRPSPKKTDGPSEQGQTLSQ